MSGFTLGKNAVLQTIAAGASITAVATGGPTLDSIERGVVIAVTILQTVLGILAHFRKPTGEKITRNGITAQEPPAYE